MRVKHVVLSWMAFPEDLSIALRQQAMSEVERRGFTGVAAYPVCRFIVCYSNNLYVLAPRPALVTTALCVLIFASRFVLHLYFRRLVEHDVAGARLLFLILLTPGPLLFGTLCAFALGDSWLSAARTSMILVTAVLCAAATLNLCIDRIARVLIPCVAILPGATYLAFGPYTESPALLPLAMIFIAYLIISSETISRDYWTLASARQKIQDLADSHKVLSITDHLTSIPNRLYFYQNFAEKCRRAEHTTNCVAVLLLDIDHFKRINDGLGHAAGDACLIAIGAFLNRILTPKCHLFARYGGEELIIAAEVESESAGRELAQQLCEGMATLRVPFDDRLLAVTCSIGYVLMRPPISESYPDQALLLADRALYDAKRAGRNTVREVRFQ